jgi:hypothetical protein
MAYAKLQKNTQGMDREQLEAFITANLFIPHSQYKMALGNLIQFLKNKLRGKKQEGVLWGWKRSKGSLISRALKNNFSYQENYYFDKNNKIIKPSTFFGLPINVDAAWQMMVFKKND